MVFKKGVSGNPKGRATIATQTKRLAADLLGPHAPQAAKEIVAQLTCYEGDYSHQMRQWAAKMIFEYAYGKPAQAVQVTGEDGGPLVAVIREIIKDK